MVIKTNTEISWHKMKGFEQFQQAQDSIFLSKSWTIPVVFESSVDEVLGDFFKYVIDIILFKIF